MSYDVPLRVAIGGNVDAGKCLGKNSKVLMFNGKIKMIQDIKIGELVMGDDSYQREVINTTSGKDIMYNIKMKKGGNYTVNSHHILCLIQNNIENVTIEKKRKLYMCKWWEGLNIKTKRFYWNNNKEKAKEEVIKYLKDEVPKLLNYTKPKTIDINVKDYLNLPKNIQVELYGYKVGITFKHINVKHDPYLLGMWLGNETCSRSEIDNIDKPIVDKINEICIKTIKNTYKEYNLDNKHIPDEYKYNSREVQLKLLAGVIDSDGNYEKGIFTITQKNKRLLKDLEFICRSLGFWTFISAKPNEMFQETIIDKKIYYKLCIIGNLDEVPTILLTKQAKPSIIRDGYMVSRIKVTKLLKNEYFGISLSGNNQRFLLGDFTVTHNSSVLGYLKTGIVDDGNGSSRSSIFNFPHEQKSGRTSSISQQTIKINNKKIIFYDLAGHEKYFKTTLFGISCNYPDIMLILIESNKGIQQMTKEHIISAIYLRIPIVIVMTKLDIALQNKLNTNIRVIKKVMKSVSKNVYEINDEHNIDIAVKTISETTVPLFKISSVKGNDINPPFRYLSDFLNKLNINISSINGNENKEKTLFVIDKSFKSEGYPLICSGYMRFGTINVNDKLFIGPINNEYIEVNIRSIHDDDKSNVSFLRKNEMGCVSIKSKNNILKHKNQLLPGMIITNTIYPFVKKFLGAVTIFSNHSTTIKIGYNTIINCGAVRTTVRIYKIEDDKGKELECLRGGDKNIQVYFEFLYGVYVVLKDDRFIFREGKTRGSGHIINIIE
jgi:elongation factor 1-alpha